MGACQTVPKRTEEEEAAVTGLEAHLGEMNTQWNKCLEDPNKVVDTAASKRSPFKFDRSNSKAMIEMDLGVSAVALPDVETSFGKRYSEMIDTIQDLWKEYMPDACKRQTTPHMSIGSVVLDKHSPDEYNVEILKRLGLVPKVKAEMDAISPAIRARIQTLKINPDGCVTFQLEHDPDQDVSLAEEELDKQLRKVPTCQEAAFEAEKKKFKKNADGSYSVTRFQQVRLAIGGLGSEIKGMYSSGHMVVVNLVDPPAMEHLSKEQLRELWSKCYDAWSPLRGEWFELSKVVCLCYVERSLNEGSVVTAPSPGATPSAFPEGSESASALLGGIFTATVDGDVLIDPVRFQARREDRSRGQWQAFNGEVRELAENKSGQNFHVTHEREAELKAAFEVFDTDKSGSITTDELAQVMKTLAEQLSDEEVEGMMKRADLDGSGNVSYDEFVSMMSSR